MISNLNATPRAFSAQSQSGSYKLISEFNSKASNAFNAQTQEFFSNAALALNAEANELVPKASLALNGKGMELVPKTALALNAKGKGIVAKFALSLDAEARESYPKTTLALIAKAPESVPETSFPLNPKAKGFVPEANLLSGLLESPGLENAGLELAIFGSRTSDKAVLEKWGYTAVEARNTTPRCVNGYAEVKATLEIALREREALMLAQKRLERHVGVLKGNKMKLTNSSSPHNADLHKSCMIVGESHGHQGIPVKVTITTQLSTGALPLQEPQKSGRAKESRMSRNRKIGHSCSLAERLDRISRYQAMTSRYNKLLYGDGNANKTMKQL